jgi:phosphohistidine swiveling domain-containing protein
LTRDDIRERLEAIRGSVTKVKKVADSPMGVDLDEETKRIAGRLDFTAVWQDERKLNILQAIYHLGCIVEEIARRTGVAADIIGYLEPTEALAIKGLEDIRLMAPELAKRIDGVFILQSPEGPDIATGDAYQAAVKIYEETSQAATKPASSAIYGSVANTGTAIGPVAICRDLASIDKVKQGDILVASMTRPEYMAAIKKAAAIVTDEGGITCHAAIVARELGIPCVIGTKVATKVFKDGDMVEVRANHGMIKRIA